MARNKKPRRSEKEVDKEPNPYDEGGRLKAGALEEDDAGNSAAVEKFRAQLWSRRNRGRPVADAVSSGDPPPVSAANTRVADSILGRYPAQSQDHVDSDPEYGRGVAYYGSRDLLDDIPGVAASAIPDSQESPEEYRDKTGKQVRMPDETFSELKLSESDIMLTSRRYCCRRRCLEEVGVEKIRNARQRLFRQKSQDRSLSLQLGIANRGEGLCVFRIEDTVVCQTAFRTIYGVGKTKLQRLKQVEGEMDPRRMSRYSRPQSVQTLATIKWMETFFKTRVEHLPNKAHAHLADNFSRKEVHNIFLLSPIARNTGIAVSYSYFLRLWKKYFKWVKIPKTNRFSTCADCEEFKTLRDKGVTAKDKRRLLDNSSRSLICTEWILDNTISHL